MKAQIAYNAVQMALIASRLSTGKPVDEAELTALYIDSDTPDAAVHNSAVKMAVMFNRMRDGEKHMANEFRWIVPLLRGDAKPETVYAWRIFSMNVEIFALSLEGKEVDYDSLPAKFHLTQSDIINLFKGE